MIHKSHKLSGYMSYFTICEAISDHVLHRLTQTAAHYLDFLDLFLRCFLRYLHIPLICLSMLNRYLLNLRYHFFLFLFEMHIVPKHHLIFVLK